MYNGDMKKLILILLLFFCFLKFADSGDGVRDGIDPVLTETRQRIAVIDSGIRRSMLDEDYMCKDMPIFTTGVSGWDYHGHGTNVVGLIGERINTKKYCITSYSLPSTENNMNDIIYFLFKMQNHNVVGVNISMASAGFNRPEGEMIKHLTDKGVKVFVAAGNEGIELGAFCDIYPACHKQKNKSIIVVGNKYNKNSNYGQYVDIWVDGNNKGYMSMTGTSQATAITTGVYFSK
jgi:hypothetical protein